MIFFQGKSFGGKLENGMQELKLGNFFTAKNYFYRSLKSRPTGAAFGLSTLYAFPQNPFYNLDSAHHYILLTKTSYLQERKKEKERLSQLNIDEISIQNLGDEIAKKSFEKAKSEGNIESLNRFAKENQTSSLAAQALLIRDQMAFDLSLKTNTCSAYQEFIRAYPKARQIKKARILNEECVFKSMTIKHTEESYWAYIKQFPQSSFRYEAEDSIFSITAHKSISELYAFVKKYPNNRNAKFAWNQLYALYKEKNGEKKLESFKINFPEFPDSAKIRRDAKLANTQLYFIRENEKWGYIDSTGKKIIACRFESAENFSDDLAEVSEDGLSGFANKDGYIVIPCLYQEVEDMHEGYSIAKKNEKFGMINRSGAEVIPFEYDNISTFSEGLAMVVQNDSVGFYDTKGRLSIPMQFKDATDFNEGMSAVAIDDSKWGYINLKGQMVIPPVFETAAAFQHGLAIVSISGKVGIINTKGDTVIPLEYEKIVICSNDLIMLVKNKLVGFSNAEGKITIPLVYDYSENMWNKIDSNFIKVGKRNKFGLIDPNGKSILSLMYEDLLPPMEERCAYKRKGRWGYLDAHYKPLISNIYEDASSFHFERAVVKKNQKYGYIDKMGNPITPFVYDEAQAFHAMNEKEPGVHPIFALVKQNGKTGIINTEGKNILPCVFDEIEFPSQDFMLVRKGNKFAYIHIQDWQYIWAESDFEK